MASFFYIWSDETVEHLADSGVTREDFEWIVDNPEDVDASRSSERIAAFGHTPDGRYLIAHYEMIDEVTIEPITAYEVPEPRQR